jgi:collagen type IV alpha
VDVEDAVDVEAAEVVAGDDASVVAAPIEDAAGIVPPPAVPVVPDVGALASMVPSPLPVPSVPGLPVPLPQAVSLPHDFICAGTAWSASKSTPNADAVAPGKAVVGRRDW